MPSMISFFSAFTTTAVVRLILMKFYSTLKKQLQLNLHGMKSCFHHHILPLGHRLKLFGGHERTLDHLLRLRGSVFTPRHPSLSLPFCSVTRRTSSRLILSSVIAIGNPLKLSPDFPPLHAGYERFRLPGVPSFYISSINISPFQ